MHISSGVNDGIDNVFELRDMMVSCSNLRVIRRDVERGDMVCQMAYFGLK
jgi:hypothetical protein